MITVYVDGGCRHNGKENNIGGWAAILKYKNYKKEIKGAVINTTNNKMELLSVIKALETIKTTNLPITVYSDSSYVLKGISGKSPWIEKWIKNDWKNRNKQPVSNKELWLRLYELKNKQCDIRFVKVKGHSGIEGNELVDILVNRAMDELEKEIKKNIT